MKKTIFLLVAALAVFLFASCSKEKDRITKAAPNKSNTKPLICHVAGTMRPVMQELAKLYEKQTGQKVEVNSAGSGELLAHIEMQKEGDVYVCHDPFLDVLMEKGLGKDAWVMAELTPVIIVQKGNPKKIKSIQDLTRKDVEVFLTDYKLSSLGRMLPTIFSKAGIDFEKLNKEKRIETNKSGSYTANMVKMKNADAAMVWNAVAFLRKDYVDIIPIDSVLPEPYIDTVTSATGKAYKLTPLRVTIADLKCSKQPEAAAKFAKWLVSDGRTEKFKEFGFTMNRDAQKQKYKDGRELNPTLRVYAGAGLRPAMDELGKAFYQTSGIKVEFDYGGSGMIITRAREERDVDLFIPGDVWYVDELNKKAGLIESKTPIAWFVPVIIVQKGNPKKITGLKDFYRKDVKTGLGNTKACRVGVVSQKIFKKAGLDISKLEPKESMTVNELGVWVKMKDVDASIVWDAIAANFADGVDAVKIPKNDNVISKVVAGLMNTSKRKTTAKRFLQFIKGKKGQKILKAKKYRTEEPK